VMTRLSLDSSRHLAYDSLSYRPSPASIKNLTIRTSPPYEDVGDSIADTERRLQRKARKDAGLPASEDVAVLGRTITRLREKIEFELDTKITSAILSVPHLVALYQDDVQDAFEHVGLEYLEPERYYKPLLWEAAAAYAGHGLGLCEHPDDPEACREEEEGMPEEVVYVVDYSRAALFTSLVVMQTATGLWEPDVRHRESFTLGLDGKARFTSEDAYWSAVKQYLQAIMVENPFWKRPEKIILVGDRVETERFQGVLKQAIEETMGAMPTVFDKDAKTVASKGAAALAWRRAPRWPPNPAQDGPPPRSDFSSLSRRAQKWAESWGL